MRPRDGARTIARSARRAWEVRDPVGVVCRRYQLVYFPVPKAASTTMKTMFAAWDEIPTAADTGFEGLETVRASRLHDRPRWLVFTIVRDPWDRLRSCFQDKIIDAHERWGAIHPGFGRYNVLARRSVFSADMSFDRFVSAIARIPDAFADEHFRSQVCLVGRRGRPVVDYWVPLDRMSDELPAVMRARGVPIDTIPHRRASDPDLVGTSYTERTYDLVARRYRRDTETFGFIGVRPT